jgi:hypothetical protein
MLSPVSPCGPGVDPDAILDVAPNPAGVGGTVSFDASRSDHTGRSTEYKWDLDGDGDFERGTGRAERTTASYATTGVRTVAVRVINPKSFAFLGGFN